MKKIILFVIGILVIPFTLGIVTSWIFPNKDYEMYVGYWESSYIFIYLLFPIIHRGKIAQIIKNKYLIFVALYLIALLILCLLIFLP